jgi:hypothetical protein
MDRREALKHIGAIPAAGFVAMGGSSLLASCCVPGSPPEGTPTTCTPKQFNCPASPTPTTHQGEVLPNLTRRQFMLRG